MLVYLYVYIYKLVGGFNPSEKYKSMGRMASHIWNGKSWNSCSKPPNTHIYIYIYINTFIEPFPASQAWHGRLPRVLEALDTLIHSSLLPVILRREKSWISFINKYLLYIIVIYLTFNNILVYRYMYTIILWWNVYIYIYECISYIHIYIG